MMSSAVAPFPFQRQCLRKTELTIAFFMAHLLLRPTIKKASTILCYESHVKSWFRKEGCHPAEYSTIFLKQVRAGLKKTLPSRRDSRSALILPMYCLTRTFRGTRSREQVLLKFATILGFVGMLRPHTFDQLNQDSFGLVVRDANSQQFARMIEGRDIYALRAALVASQTRYKVLGFVIRFQAKTQLEALAYFPNLSQPQTSYSAICPVLALKMVIARGYFKRTKFLSSFGKGSKLSSYVKLMTEDNRTISPYALRIGGRTWYISQGLDKQFVDFLGTWSSPEASARYYRETPATVLKILQKFYTSLPHPTALY